MFSDPFPSYLEHIGVSSYLSDNHTHVTAWHKRILLLCYICCLVLLLIIVSVCSFLPVCFRYGKSWFAAYHLFFHAVAYGFLCFFLFAILSLLFLPRPVPLFFWWSRGAMYSILATTLLGTSHSIYLLTSSIPCVLGVFVEILQGRVGRQVSLLDAVANGVGACGSMCLVFLVHECVVRLPTKTMNTNNE